MAHANGIRSPPVRENSAIGKRKRASASEGNERPHFGEGNDVPKTQLGSFHELLVDILDLLRSQDTSPSIFHHPISSTAEQPHAIKKAKLAEPGAVTTVASVVASRGYTNIHQFVKDVDSAISGVIQSTKDKPDDQIADDVLTVKEERDTPIVQHAKHFKQRLDTIISRELVLRPHAFPDISPGLEVGTLESLGTENSNALNGHGNSIASHRQVLTLFGSAPQARQLFSSFRQPTESRDKINLEPLRERALPNGIATTRIVPVHSSEVKGKKTAPTLGELFPQPASLVQLNPPRQSKHTATRSASVSWVNVSEASNPNRPYRRDSYATQPLATGQWLKYNVPPSPSQLATPEAKRKQRDRALSFGEPQPTLPQETMDAHNQKKEDALFRSVYSSFAPSTDNAGATIGQRTKENLWWDRYGKQKYQNMCYLTPSEDVIEDDAVVNDRSSMDVDGQASDPFKEAIDAWEPGENPLSVDNDKQAVREPPATSHEIDEILNEISDLLETLNSYQRVRNLSISNNPRSATGQNNTASGTPASPSSAEFDMYNILKSQLSIMVSSLPPWALARIDGEKLGELSISTKLQIEGESFKGTVDEEELNTKAKQVATPAPAYPRTTIPAASVPARSSYTGAAAPYQRPTYAPQTVARPTANQSSYLPNQQYSARPPSASQYLGTSRPSYAARPPSASNYPGAQQYANQAHSTPSGYPNGGRSYAGQNASYYGHQYSAAQSTPSQAQRPSSSMYQQRPVDAITYDYRASSGKARSPPQPNLAYSPPQRPYSGINATPSQPRPNLYQSNSSSYSQAPPNGSAMNGTGTSYAAYRSANEQAAFMNRQRTQLDEQQKSSSYRQTSGTPQPPNGQSSTQHSRTGTPQHYGVASGQG